MNFAVNCFYMQFKSVTKYILFSFLSLTIFSMISHAQESNVDVPALLREAKIKSDANWLRAVSEYPNYSYKWRKVWRKSDAKGKVEENSELYELFFPVKCPAKKCERVSVLLTKGGKPLSPEKIEKQRAQAGRQIEKMENTPGAAALLPDAGQPLYWMYFAFYKRGLFEKEPKLIVAIDGQEILEKCEFFSPARELINGRETIVLNFRPKPDAVFNPQTKYMPGAEGKFWIDAADKVFVRLAIWPKDLQPAGMTGDDIFARAPLARDMVRTSEGIWCAHFAHINGLDNPDFLGEMKDDFSIEQFDHHYFKTEIKEVNIKTGGQN